MTTEIQNKIDSATEHLNCSWEQGEKLALKKLDSSLATLKNAKDIHKENIQYLGKQQIESKGKSIDEFLQKDIKAQLLPSKQALDELTKKMETLSPQAQKEAVRKFIREEIGSKLTVLCSNRDDVVAALQVYVNGINDVNGKHAQIPYDATRAYREYSTGTEKRLFIDGILGPHTYKALWLALFNQDLDKIYIRKSSAVDARGVASFASSSSVSKSNDQYIKDDKEYHPGLEAIKDKTAVGFVGSDGMVYLPGPDGLWKPYADPNDKYSMADSNNNRINKPEKLPATYQKMNLFLNFYEIWKQQALETAGSLNYLNSSWGQDETKIMKDKVAQIDSVLQTSIKKINENNNPRISMSLNFDQLFKMIAEVENQEDVFGQNDIDSIKGAIVGLKPNKYKEAELTIIAKSRKKFGDALLDTVGLQGGGNSEGAKGWLIESRILNRPEFAGVNTLISNPNVLDQIKAGNEYGLTKEIQKCYILNKNALPLAKKMIKEFASIEQKVTKNKAQLRNQISDAGKINGKNSPVKQKNIMNLWNKENMGMKVTTWDQYVTQATELATKSSIEMASMMFLRDMTIEAKLTQKHLAGTAEDPELKELKGILGVGAGISDKNAEWCAEVASTVALSAVTMGAGMALAKGALTAARVVAKATRVASLVAKLEKAAVTGGKTLNWANKLTKFGVNMSKITVEGVAFYQGSNFMTNALTKNTELFDNALDWKENVKSVAFMGVLKVMGKYLGKLGTKIGAPSARVPLKIIAGTSVAVLEGAALVGASQGIEFAFGGDFHPTWEEFIQAMLLSRIASAAGKLGKGKYEFRKKGDKIVLIDQKALPEHKQFKELPAHPKALLENNPRHQEHANEGSKSETKSDVKSDSKTEPVEVKTQNPNRIAEINNELKPIVERLKELRKNGEYDLPEAKDLRIKRDKLTIEREDLLDIKTLNEPQKPLDTKVEETLDTKVQETEILNTEKAKLQNEYNDLYDTFNKSRNAEERTQINKEMIEKTRAMNELDAKIKTLNEPKTVDSKIDVRSQELLEMKQEFDLQQGRVNALKSELNSDRLNGNELNRTTKQSVLNKEIDKLTKLGSDITKLTLELSHA